MNRRETGAAGEKLACDFLCNNGYTILETNYRCRSGEIDIVAKHREVLVFVEVRTKKSFKYGTPEESITLTKRQHLRDVAVHYEQHHVNLPTEWRIDVVAIQMHGNGKVCRVEIIENAIEDV
jgi:putative endonuclease